MFDTVILQAQGSTQSFLSTLPMIGLMFLVFWLLVWRPQRQEQNRHDSFVRALKKGDKVVTASGIFGTVVSIDDQVITLEISKNTRMRVLAKQVQMSQAQVLSGDDSSNKPEVLDAEESKADKKK